MEGGMDDFGDIYTDVEGYVNGGVSMIPSIRQLYLQDRAKAGQSPGDDVDDSEDEERVLYDRTDGEGRPDCGPVAVEMVASQGSDEETPEGLGEAGVDEVAGESNEDSDSDDDLRIVLNEEDCKRFTTPPQRVGLGNGGLLAGGAGANEDEDDESMIGTGTHPPTKDYKWADPSQLPVDGLEQNGQERCGSLKGGFVLPYSQFKYVRSQSTGYASNAKIGRGFIVPSSSPTASRGDLDASGSASATSCHLGFPAIIRSAFDFHMPRNRTIFDIGMESFDQKPWRNQGIDLTDFFNFGLNEESWKQYCDNMVIFGKQATWMARNTLYGSMGTNQAVDAGFPHGPTTAEASLHEVALFERGRTATSVVEKPKGKAIQVEGGSGERLPSVDIRRPRHQDSDVVIQIHVEGFDKDATKLPRGKPEHVDNSLPHSNNGACEGHSKTNAVHNLSKLYCDDHKDEEAANCDQKDLLEAKGTVPKRPIEGLQSLSDSKGIDNDNQIKMDAPVLGTIPASTDDFLHSSSPSYTKSISEASRDSSCMDKHQSPAKRSSFGSATKSDISDGSSSDTSRAERVNDRAKLHNSSLYAEEQRCRSEKELRDVAVKDDYDSTGVHQKGLNKSDSLRRYDGKLGRRSSCNHHGVEHASSSERTEMPKGCERWRNAGKQLRLNSHIEHSRRSAVDLSSSGTCRGRQKCPGRRDSRHNNVKQVEYNIPKRHQNSEGMDFVTLKGKHTRSIPDCAPFCTEKEWSASHRSKTVDDRWWCVKSSVTQNDFDRDAPYRDRDTRNSPQRRERYDRDLHIEMDDAQGLVEDADGLWLYSHHMFSGDQTFRGSRHTNGIVWHESSPSRCHKHGSWRSSERYVRHRSISGARDAQFSEHRDWALLDPCTSDSYFSPYPDQHEFGSDCCGIAEWDRHPRNTLFSEGRKSSRVSQLRNMNDDQASLKHQELDDLHFSESCFSCKRSCRGESRCDNNKSHASLKFLHSRSLVNENGIKVPRETDSKAKEPNYVRHREAVNGRINGYEGKLIGKHGEVAHKKKKIRDDKVEGFVHTVEIHRSKENPGKRLNKVQVIRSTVEKVKQFYSESYVNHSNDEHEEPAVIHNQDVSGLEEGQLVEPEDEDAGTVTQKWDTEKTVPISSYEVEHEPDEKKTQAEDTSNNKKSVKEFDNSRILETLAKMEKRRERFKDPIAPKKEQFNAMNTSSEILLVSEEVKLERPARKRRWGALETRL